MILTKKPTADEMLKVAFEMRKHQKAFFTTRDAIELRKSKELEKQFDEMYAVYTGKVSLDEDDTNQINLFEQ